MKIAVCTAIFGGMDTPKPFPEQSVPCDFFCFTEANSPVPLPNLPDRLKAKYYKLQMHRILPDYDFFVWIDGNIEVKSPDFVKTMVDSAGVGISIQRHHERQTIKEEIDFILASDNIYLTTRYGAQPLKQEYEWYLAGGMPENTPLYSCNIFGYKHITRSHGLDTTDFFDKWWSTVLEWSWFDQSAFSYLVWLLLRYGPVKANTVSLGPMFDNPFFTLHPHNKIQ
jgi:hypothetical protein